MRLTQRLALVASSAFTALANWLIYGGIWNDLAEWDDTAGWED